MTTVRISATLPLVLILGLVASGCADVAADPDDFRSITDADVAEAEAFDPEPDLTPDNDDGQMDGPGDAPGETAATDPSGEETVNVADAAPDSTAVEPVAPEGDPQEAVLTALPPEDTGNSPEPDSGEPGSDTDTATVTVSVVEPREIKLLIPERAFKTEGAEKSLRVSFDDLDLLKVLNMEPVVADAPELMPDWLSGLDGKTIRLRGFMYPPFQDTDLEAFILARDNQICCFGRDPKVYDLVRVLMKDGVTTDYIENRPFDVVGVFHIGDDASIPGKLYTLDDAVVISR